MEARQYRSYPYRWVVLAVFMFINLTIQLLWIAYAPITGPAAAFYKVPELQIGFLSMTFMIIFIPLSIPASWVIDTFGFKRAASLGAVLMGIFGILRGLAGHNYTVVLIGTIGLAVAQPFLMNAWTKVAARWFPVEERAMAVGLATVAGLIGIAAGMVLSPLLILQMSIPMVQLVYGGMAVLSAVLFIIFSREYPPTPPSLESTEVRALMLDGLKHAVTVRQFWLYLLISFVGMGVFNGVTTWIEGIVRPRGFSPTQAGTLGALLLVGGIIGAFIIPTISDKVHKRQQFILLGVLLAIPGLIGLTFATTYWLLVVSSFFLGFFLISVSPVGMQFATEVTYPTPEGTSNGLITLFGQVSVVFVYLMEAMKNPNGSFSPALLLLIGLMVVNVLLSSMLKDAPLLRVGITTEAEMDVKP
jgi:MFS family permease